MKKVRLTTEKPPGILEEQKAGPKCADLCRRRGMPKGMIYACRGSNPG